MQVSIINSTYKSVVIIFSFSGMFLETFDVFDEKNTIGHICLIGKSTVNIDNYSFINQHVKIEAKESMPRDFSLLSRVSLFMSSDLLYLKIRNAFE